MVIYWIINGEMFGTASVTRGIAGEGVVREGNAGGSWERRIHHAAVDYSPAGAAASGREIV